MVSQMDVMNAHRAARPAHPWHLTRKVLLLLVLVVGLAFGLVVLEERGHPAPLLLFNILADVSMGVIMGFGSRILFRRHHWTVRALVAAALSIVGLSLLGSLTGFESGIGPLRPGFVSVGWLPPAAIALRVPVLPAKSLTDAADAAHMLIAMSVSWVALRAWSGSRRRRPSAWAPDAGPVSFAATPGISRVARIAAAAPAPRSTSARKAGSMVRAQRIKRTTAAGGRFKVGGTRRKLFHRRPAVQLATYEEHRCPYCLQDINPDDVRGSVECPICHTLHHKDCWDITGTCQVPHLNG